MLIDEDRWCILYCYFASSIFILCVGAPPKGRHSRTSSLRSLLRRLDETSDSRKIRLRSDSDWFFKNNTNGRK